MGGMCGMGTLCLPSWHGDALFAIWHGIWHGDALFAICGMGTLCLPSGMASDMGMLCLPLVTKGDVPNLSCCLILLIALLNMHIALFICLIGKPFRPPLFFIILSVTEDLYFRPFGIFRYDQNSSHYTTHHPFDAGY